MARRSLLLCACIVVILLVLMARSGPAFTAPPANPPTSSSSIYLPLIRQDLDLTITALEITQAVQTTTNNVPLVENRQTIVRIFAQTTSLSGTQGVTVSVSATRNGVPLPGSPLVRGPYTVPHSPSRGVYSSTVNVLLPSAWLSGNVSLVATVDPNNVIPEANETNNTASATITFNYVPPLNVKFVPIDYTYTRTGAFCPGPTSESISYWLMHTYPVHAVQVSFRAPVPFTGDLSQQYPDWSRLVGQLLSVKQADGAPASQVYYGLLDPHNSTCPLAWGGYAYIGLRVSVGHYAGYTTLAHEIGHNFGRLHAPCGDPANPDPNYPYPNASIGQYGVDVFDGRVWTPDAPDNTKDVMSYCWPVWFSDYTYRALYDDQRSNGRNLESRAGTDLLLVRGIASTDGTVSIEPAYVFGGTPTAQSEPGDAVIELLNADGRVLTSRAVTLYELEDGHERSSSTLIALPDEPVAFVRIVRSGIPMAQRLLHPPAATPSSVSVLTSTSGIVTLAWGQPDVPALVRYTADNGQSWITLGIDVLGGQMQIDISHLPGGQGYFEVRLADMLPPSPLRAPLPTALPDMPPDVRILGPTIVSTNQPLLLIGQAMDQEDGPLTALRWTVDGSEVEEGQTLQVIGLRPGEHTVALIVQDRAGHVARTEQSIRVTD